MWIMVEPIAEIPFRIRRSPTRYYRCNTQSLPVHCPYTCSECVTYEPYRLVPLWFDGAYYWHFVTDVFDHVKASLVYWAPVEWCVVLGHCHKWSSVGCYLREEVP
jgi:hypothetical protein